MSSATPPRMGRVMSIQGPVDDDGPDSFDALRDLFLGGAEERAPTPPPPDSGTDSTTTASVDQTAHPLIEALVLGNLPVQQSPWIMQYAREAAAKRGGPVALFRIREGEATLDLVGRTSDETIPGTGSLEEALAGVAPIVKGLILRVDSTSEPLLPGLPGIDALTVLTGADETAVVASYQTIKRLLATSDDQMPRLQLAIMGSTPEKAVPAAEKIRKAVSAHLNHELDVSACVARIASGRSSLIYRGLVTDDLGRIVERARELLSVRGRRQVIASPQTAVEPAVEPAGTSPRHEGAQPVVSRLGHVLPSQPSTPSMPPAESAPAARAQRPAETGTPSLAGQIPGLIPTAITCPFHPEVEFALGPGGVLNALIHAAGTGDHPRALASLLSAGAWARAHSALIAMAVGQPLNTSTPPVLHLLTGTGRGCRRIADLGIRVHLLSRVEVDGRAGWFCSEID